MKRKSDEDLKKERKRKKKKNPQGEGDVKYDERRKTMQMGIR